MHFSLVKLNPGPPPCPAGFDDAILPLYFALRELGFEAEIRVNSLHPTAKNILFGANQYARLPLDPPRGSVIFNLEQVSSGETWFTPQYLRLLREFPVWDYSGRNCAELRERFGINARHVRLGYVEEMTRIPSAEAPAHDLLFYGFLNRRRVLVLNALQQSGVRLFPPRKTLMGAERDTAIARAALVLNVHYYVPASLEVVRLGYLWANKKAVVSERGPDTEVPPGLETACAYCAYEDIVPTATRLLRDEQARRAQAEEGFRAFSALRQADILRELLGGRKYPANGPGATWERARDSAAGLGENDGTSFAVERRAAEPPAPDMPATDVRPPDMRSPDGQKDAVSPRRPASLKEKTCPRSA